MAERTENENNLHDKEFSSSGDEKVKINNSSPRLFASFEKNLFSKIAFGLFFTILVIVTLRVSYKIALHRVISGPMILGQTLLYLIVQLSRKTTSRLYESLSQEFYLFPFDDMVNKMNKTKQWNLHFIMLAPLTTTAE